VRTPSHRPSSNSALLNHDGCGIRHFAIMQDVGIISADASSNLCSFAGLPAHVYTRWANAHTGVSLRRNNLSDMNLFRFHELNQAPEVPGCYSWYYRMELASRDIQSCLQQVGQAESPEAKIAIIETFLRQRLFKPYTETPYKVSLQGRLKPPYEGDVHNQFLISSSLVQRIAEEPERLLKLKALLFESVPIFASPIYIGVAKDLRHRLLRHKSLIEKFFSAAAIGASEVDTEDEGDEEAAKDHSFAREVANIRKFSTGNLVVYTFPIEIHEHLRYDLENVLNRINYPLCGRN
jgi:hypothetical protein